MINDCAFVGVTILKYLPHDIEKKQISRSRGWWSKTFGIALKILRSKSDVYHVNYLLQDCYMALKFGKKPLVGHAHGTDLRKGLKHPLWREIVQYNLKHSSTILVSTPDILEFAKRYRKDAQYLPNPVDTQLFYPQPLREREKRLKVLIASNANWSVKGTDTAIRALSRIKDQVVVSIIQYGKDFKKTMDLAKSLSLEVHPLPMVPHDQVRRYYWKSDVVIDQFTIGSLGMISLEAIASGRPVITYVSTEYPEYEDFPLKDVNTEETIITALNNASKKFWEKEYAYVERVHGVESIIEKLVNIYGTAMNSA